MGKFKTEEELKSEFIGKYHPEYCVQLIKHMSSGLSFASFAGYLKVTGTTLYNWLKNHPEFRDAREIGYEGARLFWEKKGIEGLKGGLNATLWSFNMKNRFPNEWKDRQEIQQETVFEGTIYNPESAQEDLSMRPGDLIDRIRRRARGQNA